MYLCLGVLFFKYDFVDKNKNHALVIYLIKCSNSLVCFTLPLKKVHFAPNMGQSEHFATF